MPTGSSSRAGLAATDPVERAAAAAALGARRTTDPDALTALHALARSDAEPRVRAAALAALARVAPRPDAIDAWRHAAGDHHPVVRRRAAQVAPAVRVPSGPLVALLADDDALVAEAAAFALGERGRRAGARAVAALCGAAARHRDPLVREAAVAALGAIGDARGRDTVLAALADKPAIRRRAVLALAAFDGDDVEAAIRHALDDRDWQVRQAAEDLLAAPRGP
jgi:HEAT repeat protein